MVESSDSPLKGSSPSPPWDRVVRRGGASQVPLPNSIQASSQQGPDAASRLSTVSCSCRQLVPGTGLTLCHLSAGEDVRGPDQEHGNYMCPATVRQYSTPACE